MTVTEPISLDSPDSLEHAIDDRLAQLQRELDHLKQQLTESQRLATIGTITAVIAHEFNNLLTPIISYSQYAFQNASGDKPDFELIKKALNKSFVSAEKASKICSSMLGLARGESTFGPVEVQQIVDETLIVQARDPQKDGIALRVNIQPGLVVNCDRVQLEQVLLNLMINARQAMSGRGGSLTLKASRVEETGEVKLQVIDSGPGIPEKNLPKIFEPFFTTKGTTKKGEAKGTGLGLSICRDIVEHHKGRIEVSSEVGKGTTFSVILPGKAA